MAESRKRIEWLDCARGIAMLLVIVGHVVGTEYHPTGYVVRGLIFSMHIPLFFILSGVLYKPAMETAQLLPRAKKSARQLLLPALFVFVVWTVYLCIETPGRIISLRFWASRFFTLVFAGTNVFSIGSVQVDNIGATWFLYVLLGMRCTMDVLNLKAESKSVCLWVGALCLLGICLGETSKYLPFSYDIALGALPFFWLGTCFRNRGLKHPVKTMLVAAAVWICLTALTFTSLNERTYLELAVRRYSLFPVSFAAGAAGTLFVCAFSKLLCQWKKLAAPLNYIGRNSLTLLIIHSIDGIIKPYWFLAGHQFRTALARLIIDLVALVLVVEGKHWMEKSRHTDN